MTTLTFICVMLFQFSQFIYSDGLIHSKFKLNKNIEDGELVAAQTVSIYLICIYLLRCLYRSQGI